MVSSGYFLPPEGVRRRFKERAAYILRSHGRYAKEGIDHQSQFREALSAGGVGRKYHEGSECKHSQQYNHQ